MILNIIGSKSGKVCQKLISTLMAVVVMAFVVLGLPGLTSPAYAGPGGTQAMGTVTRFNVSDLRQSLYWYTDKLDMEYNPRSSAFPYYAQVFYREAPGTEIGLSASAPVQSGQATQTIIVDDIIKAKDYLEYKGVRVADICNVGDNHTVLAFFCDPDGNNLALRQNDFPNDFPRCGSPICNNCN